MLCGEYITIEINLGSPRANNDVMKTQDYRLRFEGHTCMDMMVLL